MKRAALAIVPALFVLGCAESDQNPFIVRVTSLNNGTTLLSDVVLADGSIPTELPPLVLTNRPYSSSVVVDESNYALDYQVDRYTVTFRATNGTPAGLDLAPFTHTEAATAVVPINGSVTLGLLVVPLSMKIAPAFLALQTGGQIPLIADIDIEGSPAIDPDKRIHVRASLSVVFANFVDAE